MSSSNTIDPNSLHVASDNQSNASESNGVEVFNPQNQGPTSTNASPPNSPLHNHNTSNNNDNNNNQTPVVPPVPVNSEASIQNTPSPSFNEESFQVKNSSNNDEKQAQQPASDHREKSRSPPSNKVDYPMGVPVANHHHHLHFPNASTSSVSPPSSNASPSRQHQNNNNHQQSQNNHDGNNSNSNNEPVGRHQQHHNNSYNNVETATTSSVSGSPPNNQNNNNDRYNHNSVSYRDASPSISSSQGQPAVAPMCIPYDLQRKVPPSLHLPHCHPHHLEKSQMYPSLLLNDDFWKDALHELKTHDIPSGGQLLFTQADVNRWHDDRVCPIGFDRREWDLLVRHFDLEDRPNGVFDSISFKDLLADIGAPCSIAMATHVIMNLRCLESGRIRCETAAFALRAVQRVIARKAVSEDLAKQVHEKRILFQVAHNQHHQDENNNNNNIGGGYSEQQQDQQQQQQQQQGLPSLNLTSIQQHQQRQTSTSRATTPRNAGGTTPRNTAHTPREHTNENNNKDIQFMVHPGIHRPVVTPIQSPPTPSSTSKNNNKTEESQQRQENTSAKTPRSARAESLTSVQQQQNNENNNRAASSRTNINTPNRAVSPNNNSVIGLPFHGAPRLGERPEFARDDRNLITEEASGIMSKSPHRQTLKWATQKKQREKQRQEEAAKQQRMEEVEDAKREKFGMKPRARSSSRDASERNGSVARGGASVAGNNTGRASSVATNSTFATTNNNNTTMNSPSSVSGRSNNNNQQSTPSSRIAQIHTALPTGEAHAVLMRARQQRADGADNFLNSKARNGLISEKPSVEYGAVLSADKTQMLWNSNQISPVVTVHRTPKTGPPTPHKGVYQNRIGAQEGTSNMGGVLNSPAGHPNVVLSPNGSIDRRPRNWR